MWSIIICEYALDQCLHFVSGSTAADISGKMAFRLKGRMRIEAQGDIFPLTSVSMVGLINHDCYCFSVNSILTNDNNTVVMQ